MKTITKGTRFVVERKGLRQLLLTATAALLVMVGVDFFASVIREMVAYHTVGTYVILFACINAFLRRKKLGRIAKKLAAMGEDDGKFSSPSPSGVSIMDAAKEFAAAVNGVSAEDEEEVFED